MSPRKNVTYSANPTHAARSAHAKGDKMFRTYDTSAIQPKRSPLPAIVGLAVLVVALIIIVVSVLNFTRSCGATQMLPAGHEVEIVVAEGEGAKSIAKTLLDDGLIASTNEFTDRVSELGVEGNLQPGVYTLVGGQSVDEIITILQTPVAANTFTVPEGSTLLQTAEIVAAATQNRITVDAFTAAAGNASYYANDYSFLADAGEQSLEGFLFPKTYPFNDDSTAESIVRSMLDQFASETATVDWSYPESQGLSRYETMKLASIVEKESDEQHRATVSSVFYNRIAAGMPLQSDATVAYVVGHDPTPEDVQAYNDYNTYYVYGLGIPTPINSPSLACIQAVCKPETTNYYYFYFEPNGSGGMNYTFSETYENHQAAYE
ncbi:MAG TPA: endolytic transglycosylase MltG [Eggerthellaceae bacterium]|nr:endolytic transglycosylase MltG [Eggerthellaceae bacterium]